MTSTPAAAALRSRGLSRVGSAFAVAPRVTPWREQTADMRRTVPGALRLDSNSISATLRTTVIATADVTPDTGNNVYGAAKQAAPPRGVPR